MLRRGTELRYGSESRALVPQPAYGSALVLSDSALSQSGGLDIRELLRILRRHLRIIIAAPVILLVVSIIFVMVVQPLYTATATVLIDPRRVNVAESSNQQAVLSNFSTDDATTESQVMLIQSVAVLQRVVEKLKLTEDEEFSPRPSLLAPIKRLFAPSRPENGASAEDMAKSQSVALLQKRLKVARQKSTFLADINVSSWDPAKAAKIANAIAESYFFEQVRSKHEATKVATDWLGRQIEELRTRVVTAEKAVAEFRATNNLIAAQGVTVNDQQITDLNNKLIEARAKTAEARAKYDQARDVAKRGSDAGSLVEALSSGIITKLRGQHAELSKNTADLSTRYTAQHPLVEAGRAQIRDTERLIQAEVQRILQSRRHEFEVASAREESLRKSLEELQGVSTESSQAQVRLRELQREADSSRTLYESFLIRHNETSAQETLEMPESRIVARADIPINPSFPKTLLILAGSIVVGVALGGALAMLADYFDARIKTLQQVEAVTGISSIAAIPMVSPRELAHLAKKGKRELQRYDAKVTRLLPPALQPPLMRYAVEKPTSIFAEAIRAVRLAIQHAAHGRGGQITMVTSSIDGEGKTTVAANLAFSFAALGARTIIVEGDLRNPQLTRSLCPGAPGGLVEVALGETPLHQAILLDQSTRLYILPAPSPENQALVAEFVFSEAMSTILDQLRHHYDMVIVDAPPIIPLVDGRMLAEYADHIVLAAHWDRTPQDALARTMAHLSYVQDRVIGTVLTQVDLRQAGLYDYNYSSAYLRPYDGAIRSNQESAA
jgi:succinoglycan biosynthesis transport protein ExoP